MKKYYIGLAILVAVSLGLTGYTLVLGSAAKTDKQTVKKAQDIAEELNDYVDKENKIPESLADAGINDAPDQIKYSKLSDERYKFCATYKTNGTSLAYVDQALINAAFSGRPGTSGFTTSGDDYEPSSLYINPSHNKGENCQTVKPHLSSTNSFDEFDFCDPESEYYSFYKDYCSEDDMGDGSFVD